MLFAWARWSRRALFNFQVSDFFQQLYGLDLQSCRCGSEKRTQAVADLDDVLIAVGQSLMTRNCLGCSVKLQIWLSFRPLLLMHALNWLNTHNLLLKCYSRPSTPNIFYSKINQSHVATLPSLSLADSYHGTGKGGSFHSSAASFHASPVTEFLCCWLMWQTYDHNHRVMVHIFPQVSNHALHTTIMSNHSNCFIATRWSCNNYPPLTCAQSSNNSIWTCPTITTGINVDHKKDAFIISYSWITKIQQL